MGYDGQDPFFWTKSNKYGFDADDSISSNGDQDQTTSKFYVPFDQY